MPETETAPASAVQTVADGVTPPTQAPAKADAMTDESARAILRGESAKVTETPPEENDDYDPETGDLKDPTESGDTPTKEEEAETPEAKAEREEAEAKKQADEETKEKTEPKRIRINRDKVGARDFAIIREMEAQGITYAEAEKNLYGDTVPKPKEETKAKTDPIAEITAKIEAAKAAKVTARTAMDLDKLDTLNDEITDLREQLRDAKEDIRTRETSEKQTAAQQYKAAETASIERVVGMYPDANTEGSPHFLAMQERAAEIRKTDPAFFDRPGWPLTLAVEIATELGIAPALKGAAKVDPKAKVEPVVPKKVVRAAPSPAPGSSTGVPTDQKAVVKAKIEATQGTSDIGAARETLRAALALK